MGTTASAAPQPVSVSGSISSVAAPQHPPPLESLHGNGAVNSRQSLSMSSSQTVKIHSGKAKSIITNKVAPVVITYNCRQEFQIHDDLFRTNYKVGRISDSMPEHYLVQGEFFMVQDVYSKADVLNTTGSYGAPNYRQVKGSYPLYGMGQPSLNGFKQVLQRLQSQGHEEVMFFCVREEPVVFLHLEENFVPYTPRRKENLHENLHGLDKEETVETLELTIRKELHDFAKLNDNVFYVYNDIEHFKGEPQRMTITCEEDIQVTEEVYRRPLFTMPLYRYYRLPLPMEGAPLEEDFDAFVTVLRESPNLSLRRDVSRPLPALLFSCQVGVGRTNLAMILGTLVLNHLKTTQEPPQAIQSLERYFYLIVFNAYLHEQYSLGFASNFSQWLCAHPWVYRLLACMDLSELASPDLVTKGARYLSPDILSTVKEMKVANFRRVPKMPVYGMSQPTSEATGAVLTHLTDEKRKYSHVLWVNLQEELVLEGNGQIFTPREPSSLGEEVQRAQKWLEVTLEQEKQMKMFKSCLTVQEVFKQYQRTHQGLFYKRIPLADCCAPKEEDFDQLLEAMKSTLAEDSHSAFVFNCSNGKGRTTTAMVIAALTVWHFNGFPEFGDDEIVSVPDAKYTKGEFKVSNNHKRLLPKEGLNETTRIDLGVRPCDRLVSCPGGVLRR
uniref:Paladin n=1 Tax=Oncorhynchus tshawytscha TaxID=74940 RepID=A0AAZ3QVA7_ONCTS